jgi:membrane dipeptidase
MVLRINLNRDLDYAGIPSGSGPDIYTQSSKLSMTKMLIVDAHEDLAYNILNFGRDYNRSAHETRRLEEESGSAAPEHNGDTLLGWPDYQRGSVAVVFSTLFVTPARRKEGDWEKVYYADFNQAHRQYRLQLDTYHELADRHPEHFRLVGSRSDLQAILADWSGPAETHPVGLVPLMEGAEGVRNPSELDEWWQEGVRLIGPAWAGTRFCGGTREPGPLTDDGRELLEGMAGPGFILDLSHMDVHAARQSLDLYPGPIVASHANAARIIPEYEGNRMLPDVVIRGLVARGGVIGVVPFCKFLDYRWNKGDPREAITLESLADQVDYICQLAGDARHVGLGSDFDGGYGVASVPAGLDTIADLQKLGPTLTSRGYNDEDVASVLGGNWLHFLEAHLPA